MDNKGLGHFLALFIRVAEVDGQAFLSHTDHFKKVTNNTSVFICHPISGATPLGDFACLKHPLKSSPHP